MSQLCPQCWKPLGTSLTSCPCGWLKNVGVARTSSGLTADISVVTAIIPTSLKEK